MNIVLSNDSCASGGVHLVTEVVARGLQAPGHEVTVLCRVDSIVAERMRGMARLEPILRGASHRAKDYVISPPESAWNNTFGWIR